MKLATEFSSSPPVLSPSQVLKDSGGRAGSERKEILKEGRRERAKEEGRGGSKGERDRRGREREEGERMGEGKEGRGGRQSRAGRAGQ
eukprot:239180-Hanusia_phi.AAC.1